MDDTGSRDALQLDGTTGGVGEDWVEEEEIVLDFRPMMATENDDGEETVDVEVMEQQSGTGGECLRPHRLAGLKGK